MKEHRMSVTISVIIPFYKTSLGKFKICIESFLNQYYKDFELILVDDGNKSEYETVIESYQKKDKRIRYIYQKNAGVSAARNKGIENAKGKYIVFCDSDDFVEPQFLELLYSKLDNYDMVICGVCEQHFPSHYSAVDMRIFCSTPSQYNWVQYTNFSVNKIFKKDIIDQYHIRFNQEYKLGEDALFINEYLSHCNFVRCIGDALYHYVPDQKSAVNTYQEKYWLWEENVINRLYSFFTKYPLNNDEENFMQRWLYTKLKGALYYYMWNAKKGGARENHIKQILKSESFKAMCKNFKKNPSLDRGDKINIWAWENLGYLGVRMSYTYRLYRLRQTDVTGVKQYEVF